MVNAHPFRTGYMSLVLPVETGEVEIGRIIRESVVHALAAAGEWPVRVEIVTSSRYNDGHTKRWFIEYETGSYGEVLNQLDQRTKAMQRP
jgi:hypothetical protein